MFTLHKGPTNYFHLTLVVIGGLTVASLLYISYLLTIVSFDELGIDSAFVPRRPVIMSLATDRLSYIPGEHVKVSVLLDIEERKTPGIDVVLAYDPMFLELVSLAPEPTPTKDKTTVKAVTTGVVRLTPQTYLDASLSKFDNLHYFSIDYDRAQIRFSALMQPLNDFQGKGEIASLYFKALKPGKSDLKLIFDRNNATDSNVAFSGRDILTNVINTTVDIK